MRRGLKNLLIHMMVFSMACPVQLFADDTGKKLRKEAQKRRRQHRKDNAEYSGWDFLGNLSNVSMQFVQQYNQQNQSMFQQQQSQQRAQSLMQELTPKTMAECQAGQAKTQAQCMRASKFFPQCTLLPPKLPQNDTCDGSLSAANIMEAQSILQISKRNAELYESGSLISHNQNQMNGLECILQGQKHMKDMLQERIKEIDDLKLQLKENDAAFTEKMDVVLNDIKKSNYLLNGGDKPFIGDDNTSNLKVSDLMADSKCSSVFDKTEDEYSSLGLKGFQTEAEKVGKTQDGVDQVSNILNNSGKIEKDIRKMAKKMARKIKTGEFKNISSLLGGGYSSTYDLKTSKAYSSFMEDMQLDAAEKLQKVTTGLEEIKQDGVDAALFDAAMDDDPNKLGDAIRKWENNKQTECMKDRFTIYDSVAGSLSDSDNRISNASRNTNLFGAKAQEILDNDQMSMTEKRDALLKLELKDNPNRTMFISLEQEVGGQKPGYPWSIAGLYSVYARDCDTIWKGQTDFGSYTGSSVVTKLKNMQAEYKNASQEFINTFETKMVDKLINCGGETPAVSPKTCSATAIDIQSDSNFCLKGAQACAASMKACAAKAKQVTKKIKQGLKKTARQYNNEVVAYKKAQYITLKAQITKFKSQAKILNRQLPGINFNLPEILNIGKEKKGDKKYVDGIEDANVLDHTDYLSKLEAGLDDVKKKIEEQNKLAETEIQAMIDNVKENYTKEAARQKEVASKCQGQIDTYKQMVEQANQQAMKDAEEKNQKIRAFCSSASGFSAKPGCGNAEQLTDDAADVLAFLPDTDARKLGEIREYSEICNESSNADDGSIVPGVEYTSVSKYCGMDPYSETDVCLEYNSRVADCKDDDMSQQNECIKERRVAASKAANAYSLNLHQEQQTSDMGEQSRFELCTARSMGMMGDGMKGMSDSLMDLNNMTNPMMGASYK